MDEALVKIISKAQRVKNWTRDADTIEVADWVLKQRWRNVTGNVTDGSNVTECPECAKRKAAAAERVRRHREKGDAGGKVSGRAEDGAA